MKKILLFIILLLALMGCRRPYMTEHIEEIGPNETAYLIPLEGENLEESSQVKFESIDYLDERKVATKRVTLPQRFLQDSYMGHEGYWIDSARLIKVDRSPVTREWTQAEGTGTSNKNEAIEVESKDSIEFSVGCNITARVEESDTSKYLYYYTGIPLSEIIDTNIRSYVQTVLGREFANLDLVDGRGSKADIIGLAFQETSEHFAQFGITIDNLGISGGLIYADAEIQKAINEKFTAEMAVQIAEQNRLEQETINQMNEEIATSEKNQAYEFAKAMNALIERTELEIKSKMAEAYLVQSQNWNGELPDNLMPADSSFLFSLPAE